MNQELKRVVQGAANPLGWLLRGIPPVDSYRSLSRAATCVACPKNGVGPLTQWFTVPAANAIKKALEERTGHKLTTLYDAALGVCEACYCPLPLKVHEPIDLVLEGLKPEVKADLWEKCWIRREASETDSETTHANKSDSHLP